MTTVLDGVEFAMNRFICSWTRKRKLDSRRCRVPELPLTIEGPALVVEAELGPNGVRLGSLSERPKDVRISGSPLALLRMVPRGTHVWRRKWRPTSRFRVMSNLFNS